MNLSEYRAQVRQIPYGKRLPTALYVHREGLAHIGGSLGAILDQVVARYQVSAEFNLVKFRTDELKLSFLSYPEFESVPHPALRHAITIDLVTGKARHTDYAQGCEPPIDTDAQGCLTGGTGENGDASGGKADAPHPACGQVLLGTGNVAGVVVERHKTATTRYELSKPVKSLLEYGVLRSGTTFFDYGCRQGTDVHRLQGLSYEAEGWDRVFWRDAPKREADRTRRVRIAVAFAEAWAFCVGGIRSDKDHRDCRDCPLLLACR